MQNEYGLGVQTSLKTSKENNMTKQEIIKTIEVFFKTKCIMFYDDLNKKVITSDRLIIELLADKIKVLEPTNEAEDILKEIFDKNCIKNPDNCKRPSPCKDNFCCMNYEKDQYCVWDKNVELRNMPKE